MEGLLLHNKHRKLGMLVRFPRDSASDGQTTDGGQVIWSCAARNFIRWFRSGGRMSESGTETEEQLDHVL
jgi:hypothetical protein